MSVVIDSNTISVVFNKNNKEHSDFEPVLFWIIKGPAKIVIGGTTYKNELRRLRSYLPIIKELSRLNKVYSYPQDKDIDDKENEIIEYVGSKRLDDAHIIALLAVTKTRIFCSNDARSFPYITQQKHYVSSFYRPKIYTNKFHAPNKSILCKENLSHFCDPNDVLSKKQRNSFLKNFKLCQEDDVK